ncbi:MAG: phage tail sheath C-terminal domain-containing protein [Xanthomonadales bacterium]|jgi:phage tail sheath protein FI|nr:phage tail sheath C-terminal domain-containing protein [Xanthomonadales bacterium]
MARLSYQAPGVYVEEVPSAQQPIAGVGTNTVGFIGVVPDEIQYPEANPDYDPVSAQLALEVARIIDAGGSLPKKKKAELEQQIKELDKQIEPLKKNVSTRRKELNEKSQKLPQIEIEEQEALASFEENLPPELSASDRKKQITKKKEEIDANVRAKNKEVKDLSESIENDEKAIQQLEDEKGILQTQLEGKAVSPQTKVGTRLCPYKLETFTVNVQPGQTKLCTNFSEYKDHFGPFSADKPDQLEKPHLPIFPGHRWLTHAVNGFFNNGGTRCFVARVNPTSQGGANMGEIKRALVAFESIDAVAIVAAPGIADPAVWQEIVAHCETCEDRFAIFDCPEVVGTEEELDIKQLSYDSPDNVLPQRSKNAAFYFPYIEVVDPAKQMQDEDPGRGVSLKYAGRIFVPPSGHIAGIYARSDEKRGVHKAPANEAVRGALNVKYYIGKPKQEMLNPQGVNVIRNINGNITVWGARTIGGDRNGEWKYVNVRRFFLFLAESIDEGTQWVVFEPNDRALWGKIKRNVGAFLTNIWRSGALFGATPEEAFYVKCDDETNPPEVRDLGQVVTEIGVAIVRPAEFVIFRITQSTGPRT